jgi:hypothetical protein
LKGLLVLISVLALLFLRAGSVFAQEAAGGGEPQLLQTDRVAWESIDEMDLAKLEEHLEDGWRQLSDFTRAGLDQNPLGSIPASDPRVRIIWDQIYYRLLAFAGDAYAQTLHFAERVIYPDIARARLQSLELSCDRLWLLVELIHMVPANKVRPVIDPLATAIVPDYQARIVKFRRELDRRGRDLQTRLESGEPAGIVDTATLAQDAIYEQEYAEHRQQIEDPATALGEAYRSITSFAEKDVDAYVACADTVSDRASGTFLLNAAKYKLASLEDALAKARRILLTMSLSPYAGGDADQLQVLETLAGAVSLYHDPPRLERLYAQGERIDTHEREVSRRPYAVAGSPAGGSEAMADR